MATTLSRSRALHEPPEAEHGHPGRPRALFGGVAAAVVAAWGMVLLRATLQVRSVAERLMEWLLLFIPPSLFEATLQRFGFDAKRYALALSAVLLIGLLAWLGYVVLRRRWSVVAIAALGLGLWLVVMVVIMPLTNAGFFALDLLDGKRAAIGGYLAIALSYAAVLVLFRTAQVAPAPDTDAGVSRRGAIALLGATAVAYVGTYLAANFL